MSIVIKSLLVPGALKNSFGKELAFQVRQSPKIKPDNLQIQLVSSSLDLFGIDSLMRRELGTR